MKPDPDMMRQAHSRTNNALEAIGRFQLFSGFAFGSDATHASSYKHIADLADALQSIGSQIHLDLLEVDARLSPAARRPDTQSNEEPEA